MLKSVSNIVNFGCRFNKNTMLLIVLKRTLLNLEPQSKSNGSEDAEILPVCTSDRWYTYPQT